MVTVEVTNTKEVEDFIRRSSDEVKSKAVRIIKDAVMVCMDYAKQIAPHVTGRYKTSIHFELPNSQPFSYTDDSGKRFDGSFTEKPREGEIFVGTNVEYAPFIEHGTSKMAAQNVLKRAAEKAQFYLITRMNELTR